MIIYCLNCGKPFKSSIRESDIGPSKEAFIIRCPFCGDVIEINPEYERERLNENETK